MLVQTASNKTRRWAIGGGLTAAVIAIAGVAVAVQANDGKKPDAEKKPADKVLQFNPSEVVQPSKLALPSSIEFSGALVAPNTAVVRAKGGGILVALSSPEGSRVKAGQSLGTLDLEDLRQRVMERAASVEAAKGPGRPGAAQLPGQRGPGQAELHCHHRLGRQPRQHGRRPRAARRRASAVANHAGAAAPGQPDQPDQRLGRQAPRRAGREAAGRAAGAHRRRPLQPGAGRPGRHPRGGAAQARHGGHRAHRRHDRAGEREDCPASARRPSPARARSA